METRHIRLDYEETLISKKQLLSSELSLLHIFKRLKTYRILRKKEIATKNKLRNSLISLKTKINLMQSIFPNPKEKIRFQKRKKRVKKEHRKNIQEELEEIQEKLAKLK